MTRSSKVPINGTKVRQQLKALNITPQLLAVLVGRADRASVYQWLREELMPKDVADYLTNLGINT